MTKRTMTESQQVVRQAIRAAVLIREHLAGPARKAQFDGLPVVLVPVEHHPADRAAAGVLGNQVEATDLDDPLRADHLIGHRQAVHQRLLAWASQFGPRVQNLADQADKLLLRIALIGEAEGLASPLKD